MRMRLEWNNGKEGTVTPILTARMSNNAKVFADILRLYVPSGALIADVTYGKGAFWKESPKDVFKIISSDYSFQRHIAFRADATCLPYRNASIDALVFDGPYGSLSSTGRTDGVAAYYNCEPTTGEQRLRDLYLEGVFEASRVLKPKGIFIVKVQDFVNSGHQHFFHADVIEMCRVDFEDLDLFVVAREKLTMQRHKVQKHAWKNHSFFLVFRRRR